MPWRGPSLPGEFPTLGYLVADWIEARCAIPDREYVGSPFLLTDEQLRFVLSFYRLDPGTGRFYFHRGGQLVRPQKWGKGPLSAAVICAEAQGPVCFDGWDADGEPVGKPWATPLIQVTAVSEDQTDNVYSALLPMIELGALGGDIEDTGLGRINLPGGGRIKPVTASAISRLGQRITFALQDQALALDTPLPTPFGWTSMGKVRDGDALLGASGEPVRVKRAKPVQRDHRCYRVGFADATSMVASAGHLWLTKVARSGAKPRVRTTEEMADDGRRFRVPAPQAYVLPEADLPVDPYVLGLWLGDGTTGQAAITVGDRDLNETRALLLGCGWPSKVQRYGTRAPALALSSQLGYQSSGRPDHVKALQALPCYRAKHVPAQYLRASIAQRVALLQGLMDSDGSVTHDGHCTFVGNDQLSADVLALLRTLGQVARRVWRARPEDRAGGIWKVNFKPRGALMPFRLSRKMSRVVPVKRGAEWVTIASLDLVPSVPVRCIEVEAEDHLFLAGEGGHVTHNTESWTESNKGRKLADNQRRGLAGMGGRWLSTPNAWDPTEDSVAQYTSEHEHEGVLHDDVTPPDSLSIRNKAERRRALKIAYGDSVTGKRSDPGEIEPWINLDRIDAEIKALLPRDPAQAERWFLNRKEAPEAKAFRVSVLDERAVAAVPAAGAFIVVGVDGARFRDALAIVATEIHTGVQWPIGIWERPDPAPDDYEHPFDEVDGAMAEAFETYDVWRAYIDPQYIDYLVNTWQGRWGEGRVIEWLTNRPRQTAFAVRHYTQALEAGDATLVPDEKLLRHLKNAVRWRTSVRDDDHRQMYVIGKDRTDSPHKMDAAMGALLSWEARGDAIAANAQPTKRDSVYEERGLVSA